MIPFRFRSLKSPEYINILNKNLVGVQSKSCIANSTASLWLRAQYRFKHHLSTERAEEIGQEPVSQDLVQLDQQSSSCFSYNSGLVTYFRDN